MSTGSAMLFMSEKLLTTRGKHYKKYHLLPYIPYKIYCFVFLIYKNIEKNTPGMVVIRYSCIETNKKGVNVMVFKKICLTSVFSVCLTSSVFAASDVNVDIVGEVVTDTCDISIGGSDRATITIGNWKPEEFAVDEIGPTSFKVAPKEQPILISLSNCSGAAGATSVRMNTSSVIASTSDGDILNIGGGSSAGAIVYEEGATQALKNGDTFTVTTVGTTAPSGSKSLYTRMASQGVATTDLPTTGKVAASVQFLMQPN
ncbi:type 1 fimbrial protein [Enterobacter asburiae]|nr:type 1 fimbrial protein [Enterobacter asburiae]